MNQSKHKGKFFEIFKEIYKEVINIRQMPRLLIIGKQWSVQALKQRTEGTPELVVLVI